MNAVLMILHNTTPEQLELSKRTFETIMAQDVGRQDIYIINNCSEEATAIWLDGMVGQSGLHRGVKIGEHSLFVEHLDEFVSPCKVANRLMGHLFDGLHHRHILRVANRDELSPHAHTVMLLCPAGMVRGYGTNLIRRWCYDALMDRQGYFFDEKFEDWGARVVLMLEEMRIGIGDVG